MAPITVKSMIPKESIKTQKVSNSPILISKLEPLRADISVLSIVTRASVTPEKIIQI